MALSRYFATDIYTSSLADRPGWRELRADLEATIFAMAADDQAGQAWCEAHGYEGYTSYASLDDLVRRATCFRRLARLLKTHADAYASALAFDLGGRGLELDSLWVNVLAPGGSHSGHIHPNCAISGTVYVVVPEGSSAIRFEDPRLGLMMAAPPLAPDCPSERRRFVTVQPRAGDLLLWESWLRHEVPANRADADRVSISFNFRLR